VQKEGEKTPKVGVANNQRKGITHYEAVITENNYFAMRSLTRRESLLFGSLGEALSTGKLIIITT
jgi:hypothetical protein